MSKLRKKKKQVPLLRNKKLMGDLKRSYEETFVCRGQDHLVLDFIMSLYVSKKWKGDKAWGYIIGSSGGGKSAVTNPLAGEDIVHISRLTPQSLISGYRGRGDDPSLLPLLDGCLLIIKDFTSILTMNRESRESVIGMLRDCYDGRCSKGFGNIGLQSYDSSFGILACVTPVIDGYFSVTAQLGERFVNFRLENPATKEIITRSLRNALSDEKQTIAFSLKCEEVVERFVVPDEMMFDLDEETITELVELSNIVAVCRSHVHRSGPARSIASFPSPETAGRLVKQLAKIVMGHCVCWGVTKVGDQQRELMRKVARDTIPKTTACVIQQVYEMQLNDNGPVTVKTLKKHINLGNTTIRERLEDLECLKILTASGSYKARFKLRKDVFESMQSTGIWEV